MNANAVHNVLNFFGLIVSALLLYDWTLLGLTPAQAAAVSAGVMLADKVIKIGINIGRDGPAGLFKPQPPVEK